mmetsp:Transcript_40804/g.64695  ORF Transcript_40804/g.64695 Transcript_40804/m.64695 type:complete len:442 (+) Transcript_40804:67-1392(+)
MVISKESSGSRFVLTTKRNSAGSTVARHIVVGVLVAIVSSSCRSLLASSITHSSSFDFRRRLDGETETPGVWIAMACMAVLMKLTSSADDVVWLLPFISTGQKRRNAGFYICCMQLVVLISWGFTVGGEKLLALFIPDDPSWPLSRVLQLMSAIMLTLYTFKLFWDWWKEWSSDDDESADSSSPTDPNSVDGSWEVAWDPTCQRYYYQDRARGISSWCRPADCSFDLPQEQPGDAIGAPVVVPSSLPPGWSVAWDCKSQCFYYYNSQTFARTWERPESNAETDIESRREASCPVPAAWGDEVVSLEAVEVGHLAEESAVARAPIQPDNQSRVQGDADTRKEATTKKNADGDKFTITKLFTIAMMGSMDDFAVFVSLMLSDVMSAPQLMVGVLLGSMIVVVLCAGAGLFRCVVRAIEKVPLWCIIGAFAIWTYISTFVMDSE